MPGRFEGKQALVLGVANKRSIAWAIAERLAAEGAQLAFTYQGERIEKSVRDLAATVDTKLVTECDVRSDDDLDRVFAETAEAFGGGLDLLVHSVAFAAAEDLEGRFTDTPRDRFWMAVDISAYSLVACARRAEPLMEERGGGAIVTMTYLGGVRAVPHYNVMGVAKATLDASMRYLAWDLGQKQIRVNAISAGPVRTLAARSIAGFTTMEEMFERARAAPPPHRRGRLRRRGRLPPLGRREERVRHDAVRRRRVPRDGDVAATRFRDAHGWLHSGHEARAAAASPDAGHPGSRSVAGPGPVAASGSAPRSVRSIVALVLLSLVGSDSAAAPPLIDPRGSRPSRARLAWAAAPALGLQLLRSRRRPAAGVSRPRLAGSRSHSNEGDVVDDKLEGKKKQAEGKAQETWGEVKDKVGDAWDDAKDEIDDLRDRDDETDDEVERERAV